MNNEKPRVILLHGWGGNVSSWNQNIQHLESAGYRCFAVRMPGFDLPEPDPSWGVPEYAEFVVSEVKSRFGNSKFVLVGHSFGGRLAIYIASHHPKLVERLVLTDSAGLNLEPRLIRATLVLASKLFSRLEERLGSLLTIRQLGVRLLGSRNYKSASPTMKSVMKKVVNLDLRDNLPHIRCKTLIVWGEKDKTTPITMAAALQHGIRNSKLVIIQGAGHNAHSSHSKEWNETVIKFLSSE